MDRALNGKQKRQLRKLAHALDPVVQIGLAGVTPGVMAQVDEALAVHELIKVKLGQECPDDRVEAIASLLQASKSDLVQRLGRVLVLFRARKKDPRIQLLPGGRHRKS